MIDYAQLCPWYSKIQKASVSYMYVCMYHITTIEDCLPLLSDVYKIHSLATVDYYHNR